MYALLEHRFFTVSVQNSFTLLYSFFYNLIIFQIPKFYACNNCYTK